MVRTKADSVPGTYRKGEAGEHSSGAQVVGDAGAPHGPVNQTGPARPEAVARPFNQEEDAARVGEGYPAVQDRGALLSKCLDWGLWWECDSEFRCRNLTARF